MMEGPVGVSSTPALESSIMSSLRPFQSSNLMEEKQRRGMFRRRQSLPLEQPSVRQVNTHELYRIPVTPIQVQFIVESSASSIASSEEEDDEQEQQSELTSSNLNREQQDIHCAASPQSVCTSGSSSFRTTVIEHHDRKIQLQPLVRCAAREASSDVTIVFAIRRPGCGNCREHAMQLNELATQENAAMIGVVKHGAGVDDDAMYNFSMRYFGPHRPLYKDGDWKLYKCLGSRRFSVWKLLANVPRMTLRYKRKNIENIPFGGDIFTQGGILIFDTKGTLRYTHYENYTETLDLNRLRAAIHEAREYHDQLYSAPAPASNAATSSSGSLEPERDELIETSDDSEDADADGLIEI